MPVQQAVTPPGSVITGDGNGPFSPYGTSRTAILRYLSDLYGGGFVAETFDANDLSNQTSGSDYAMNLVSGRQYMSAIWIPKTTLLTASSLVQWYQITPGVYTANNFNGVALYSSDASPTTVTLRMSNTASDTTVFKAAAGTANKAFAGSGNYTAPPGLYWLSLLWSSSATTTAPEISGLKSLNSAHTNLDQVTLPLGVNWSVTAVDTVTAFASTITVPSTNRMTATYPWLYLTK